MSDENNRQYAIRMTRAWRKMDEATSGLTNHEVLKLLGCVVYASLKQERMHLLPSVIALIGAHAIEASKHGMPSDTGH